MKKKRFAFWLYLTFAVVFFMAACLLLSSCRTQYVPVPEYHTEYVNRTDTVTKTDTVQNDRQIIIREATKDDSVMLSEYGIRLKDNERIMLLLRTELERLKSNRTEVLHDTIVRTDSISVPYPVERELTFWQKLKKGTAEALTTLCLAVLMAVFFVLFLLSKKKN